MQVEIKFLGPEYSTFTVELDETKETYEEVGLSWLKGHQEGQIAKMICCTDDRDDGQVLWAGKIVTGSEANTQDDDAEERYEAGQAITIDVD